MEKLNIKGGRRLSGDVEISGAKNSALPILAAAILTEGTSRLTNVPGVVDIATLCGILSNLGMQIERSGANGDTIELSMGKLSSFEASYDLVRRMRASVVVLGPMLARFGRARVSLPGGCAIGERPINMHLSALAKMGADINMDHGYVDARATSLRGAEICLDYPTVGGTENIMCAASLAKGTTIIENAAREPEVVDLADFLNKAGAKIAGAGSDHIEIEGVSSLSGVEHRIIPDRVEAGTYAIAGAITGGKVRLRKARADHLTAVLNKLQEAGCELSVSEDSFEVLSPGRPRPVNVTTRPYPGYPTDLQAQWMAFMSLAKGASVLRETVFERRFTHVPELRRLGADITVDGDTAVVTGVSDLVGAQVMATDIRASASLILAGLAASNTTTINRLYHLRRGYARLEEKLRGVGAVIECVEE